MKAKLIVEGKEFPIEIQDPELQKLLKPPKKTGYERVSKGCAYHFVDADNIINGYDEDEYGDVDDVYYEYANYYSDRTVAENNARADKLMRQLRRFAVEHRNGELDWSKKIDFRHIGFGIESKELMALGVGWCRYAGEIIFDSQDAAQLAIETFHDELIWYFTEYKDSL